MAPLGHLPGADLGFCWFPQTLKMFRRSDQPSVCVCMCVCCSGDMKPVPPIQSNLLRHKMVP